MTRGPKPHRRRRAGLVAALLAVLALVGLAPAASQTPPDVRQRPCALNDAASRASCANQPLDAFLQQKAEEPRPDNSLQTTGLGLQLKPAQVGKPYGPVWLAIGGRKPYRPTMYGLPRSLTVTEDGALSGTPVAGDAGDYPFGVLIRDADGREVRMYYKLRITGGRVVVDGRKIIEPPIPPIPPVPAPPQGPGEDGWMAVYVLRKATFAALAASAPPTPAAPSAAGSGPPAPPAVVAAKANVATASGPGGLPANFADLVAPLVNVEYPSRDLFEVAVAAKYGSDPVALTPAQLNRVADKAREIRRFDRAPLLNWSPEAGCGCALPIGSQAKVVYGFFPFWRSQDPPPSIIFSRVSRIGFLGAQLSESGAWIRPTSPALLKPKTLTQPGQDPSDVEGWWRQTSQFARAAHAHGARLDLVLQRSDWGFLRRLDPVQRTALAETAARQAVDLADTPLRNDWAGALLLPFWNEPHYVFDGITVMFDLPDEQATQNHQAYLQDVDAYVHFHDAFIRALIREMQASRRGYVLNIVAPDPLGGADKLKMDDSTMDETSIWRSFLTYKRLAEPPAFHTAAPAEDRARFQGRTKIRLYLIAPLRERTGDSKKSIRAAIDQLKEVRGYNRVAVLNSILPILYLPAGEGPFEPPAKAKPGKAVPRTPDEKRSLDDDIVYFKQNFGGLALWPAPIQKTGIAEEVYADLERNFFQPDSSPTAKRLAKVKIVKGPALMCSLFLRLGWQLLVLVTLGAAIAYVVWGQTSGRAALYRRGLIMLAIALAGLSYFLLTVDPALAALSRGNLPLIAMLGSAVAATGWFTVKPRIPRP